MKKIMKNIAACDVFNAVVFVVMCVTIIGWIVCSVNFYGHQDFYLWSGSSLLMMAVAYPMGLFLHKEMKDEAEDNPNGGYLYGTPQVVELIGASMYTWWLHILNSQFIHSNVIQTAIHIYVWMFIIMGVMMIVSVIACVILDR